MDLPKDVHDGLKAEFKSAVVTDEELCDTIREVLDSYDYWTDPHTGIAFAAAHQLGYIDWDECQKKASSAPVALMATASPCKFQESVTTALGKDKWKEYMDNEFPEVAKEILARQEEPPVLYEAKAGKSFEENQVEWEKKARELIEEL
jgi:threonine synthase